MKIRLWLFFVLTSFGICISINAGAKEWYDEDVNMDLVKQAWTIPGGGGGHTPYYSLTLNGEALKGEREWLLRWNALEQVRNILEGKRVIELGCNIGLLSIFLTKYWNAQCVGLDCPDAKLAAKGTPDLIKSAKLVQEAFGVQFPIFQLDLDNDNYEAVLGANYDVGICFSVKYWVVKKDRLLRYLSQFKHVLFEGHHSNGFEISQFKRFGFNNHKVLATTHAGVHHPPHSVKSIIHFWK